MNDVFAVLQPLLTRSSPLSNFRVEFETLQQQLRGRELATCRAAYRLAIAAHDLHEGRAGTADVAVLLRQVILALHRRLEVSDELWRLLQARAEETGLRATRVTDDGRVEVMADPWRPAWLPGSDEIDTLAVRRDNISVPGDGILYAMTGFTTYQSRDQEAAVHSWMFAAPGSTTLITLPTGGGKSLCTLMPAWFASQGGRRKGSVTLVVVPTVSLAIDQRAHTIPYFQGAVGPEYTPQHLTGATPEDIRTVIRKGIYDGTLPILYTSPEALMQPAMRQLCLSAAAAGKLTRLVIDEAHLVETWGAGFRTEFQFLSSFRRQLLAASGNTLRTLLLSATVSSECETLLAHLFGGPSGLCRVLANRLRPEISYWFNHVRDEQIRQDRVLEALQHLPRPAILYVTRPRDAEAWVTLLRHEGFKRVAAFSGRTDGDERLRLVHEWSTNQRDVMVATSAFGVGVDKPDVRTVIHACLPENLDRYYQEAGRGGRDGCSSISLAVICNADVKLAEDMTTNARITAPTALDRWQGMRRTQQYQSQRGDEVVIDLDAVPLNEPEMPRGELNREWNEHVLLLMQRAGCIEIQDVGPGEVLAESPAHTGWGTGKARCARLRVLETPATNDESDFLRVIESRRQSERARIVQNVERMDEFVRSYASERQEHCVATQLRRLYPYTSMSCGGCPACRAQDQPPYADLAELVVDVQVERPVAVELTEELEHRVAGYDALNVRWDGARSYEELMKALELLPDLVGAGIGQLIVPERLLEDREWVDGLIRRLAEYRRRVHVLLPSTWITENKDRPLYPLATGVIYPPDDAQADRIFHALQDRLRRFPQAPPLIHIVHAALYLPGEHGRFLDRVNALQMSIEHLQELLQLATTRVSWF